MINDLSKDLEDNKWIVVKEFKFINYEDYRTSKQILQGVLELNGLFRLVDYKINIKTFSESHKK